MTNERVVCGVARMDKFLDRTWEEFEQWIKYTIGSDFRWCVRPRDTAENREMVVALFWKISNEARGFSLKRTHLSRENKGDK